jgi:hypothetical protein
MLGFAGRPVRHSSDLAPPAGPASTRFFNSLSAVSITTFSALRLSMPSIGIARSTARLYVTSVAPLPVGVRVYEPRWDFCIWPLTSVQDTRCSSCQT